MNHVLFQIIRLIFQWFNIRPIPINSCKMRSYQSPVFLISGLYCTCSILFFFKTTFILYQGGWGVTNWFLWRSVLKWTKFSAVPNSLLTCKRVKRIFFFFCIRINRFIQFKGNWKKKWTIIRENIAFLMRKITFFSSYTLLNVRCELDA